MSIRNPELRINLRSRQRGGGKTRALVLAGAVVGAGYVLGQLMSTEAQPVKAAPDRQVSGTPTPGTPTPTLTEVLALGTRVAKAEAKANALEAVATRAEEQRRLSTPTPKPAEQAREANVWATAMAEQREDMRQQAKDNRDLIQLIREERAKQWEATKLFLIGLFGKLPGTEQDNQPVTTARPAVTRAPAATREPVRTTEPRVELACNYSQKVFDSRAPQGFVLPRFPIARSAENSITKLTFEDGTQVALVSPKKDSRFQLNVKEGKDGAGLVSASETAYCGGSEEEVRNLASKEGNNVFFVNFADGKVSTVEGSGAGELANRLDLSLNDGSSIKSIPLSGVEGDKSVAPTGKDYSPAVKAAPAAGQCEDGKELGVWAAPAKNLLPEIDFGSPYNMITEVSTPGGGFHGFDRSVVTVEGEQGFDVRVKEGMARTFHAMQFCGNMDEVIAWAKKAHVVSLMQASRDPNGNQPSADEIGVYRLNSDGSVRTLKPGRHSEQQIADLFVVRR